MTITKTKQPAFHITGETGWINDPNGLIYYKGKYHVFFQYHPYDTVWGPMHWGHVVSEDLTNWQYLPIALKPGDIGDEDGCFSGSAIEFNGKLYLMYTGFAENQGGDSIRQLQCLAESEDGINFKKHGVVIGEDKLPAGYAPCDFRDPKVWRHDDQFWCVVAARKYDGKGRVLLYKSLDLFDWTFVNDVFQKDSLGVMIECPDYNQELSYMFTCEQFQPSENDVHLNVHTCRYHIGKLDYSTGVFNEQTRGIVDYGFDIYAPQTFSGTNVVIGWLNMWDRNVPSAKYGFAGMLTVPRKVSVKDGKLFQEPIVNVKEGLIQNVEDRLNDNVTKGVITIKARGLHDLSLKMRSNGENYTELTLKDGQWVFNRAKSGEEIKGVEKDVDSLAGIRRMPCSMNEEIILTIVLDEFSVEVFEDGNALSSTIYPPVDANELILSVKADNCTYQKSKIV
ncbi:MAG: glycoside hydrolase family 32 protein [Clostridia bacterium]|nr:glycoside hydrolase family 32 protein [Clostridia bacterium]